MKRSLTTTYSVPTYLVKTATIVLLFLGSLGIIGGSFLLRKTFSSTAETQTISDLSRYKEIRNQLWSNQTLIKDFPTEIPGNASNVRLVYSPALSQSGSYFQLRLKQSPQNIEKLLLHYREISKYKYIGGNTNDHANLPNGVPTTFFYTSDSHQDSFPPSYEILVLDAHDKGRRDFKWNHGDSSGVAIDRSVAEIVYWAEQW